jgi:prepilin-type N-terminal cleavage/methylation domain-containing protein
MEVVLSAQRKTSGFTLIELLVVIAIIGMLSSVVLASLASSRAKANDGSIKSNLDTIRKQAALIYADSGGYINICSDATIVRALNEALAKGGATVVDTLYGDLTDPIRVTCRANTTGYMIVAPLKSSAANAWCVDSTGSSKLEANNYTAMNTPNTLVVCP